MANLIVPLLAGLAGPILSGISSYAVRKKEGGKIRRPRYVHGGMVMNKRRRGEAVHTAYITSQHPSGHPDGVMYTASKYNGSGLAVMHKFPLISRPRQYKNGMGVVNSPRHKIPSQPYLDMVMSSPKYKIIDSINTKSRRKRINGSGVVTSDPRLVNVGNGLAVMHKWPLISRPRQYRNGSGVCSPISRPTELVDIKKTYYVPPHVRGNGIVRGHLKTSTVRGGLVRVI